MFFTLKAGPVSCFLLNTSIFLNDATFYFESIMDIVYNNISLPLPKTKEHFTVLWFRDTVLS